MARKAAAVAKIRPVEAHSPRAAAKAVSRAELLRLPPAERERAAAAMARQDAYFNALSAALEERRRKESAEQQIERRNREQYDRFLIDEHEKERLLQKSFDANLVKAHGIALRWKAIIEFWPTACERHPKNRDKRHDLIREHLAGKGLEIAERTLLSDDLPQLRKMGLIPRKE